MVEYLAEQTAKRVAREIDGFVFRCIQVFLRSKEVPRWCKFLARHFPKKYILIEQSMQTPKSAIKIRVLFIAWSTVIDLGSTEIYY